MLKKLKQKNILNYFVYSLIVVLTLMLVIYLRAWYRIHKAYQLTIPVIGNHLNEIKYEELENYIAENPDFVLYMCTSHETKCRDFEKAFRQTIKKYNLKDQIIYLNLNEYVQKDTNANLLLNQDWQLAPLLTIESFLSSYPSIAIFKDKKLFDFIIVKNGININSVNQFLEEYEIIMKP